MHVTRFLNGVVWYDCIQKKEETKKRKSTKNRFEIVYQKDKELKAPFSILFCGSAG